MYNFKSNPMESACATWEPNGCAVIFDIIPLKAEVVIEDIIPVEENIYDLMAGSYSYTISANNYKTHEGIIKVTNEDEINHEVKKLNKRSKI